MELREQFEENFPSEDMCSLMSHRRNLHSMSNNFQFHQ